MLIFHHIKDLRRFLLHKRTLLTDIGFVPTMGALHKGHLSLIEQSKAQTRLTVCSIFINPTQFNDPADFAKYPVTLHQDIQLLLFAGTDVLFLPDVREMYPEEHDYPLFYELGYYETVLEGAYRPGHFQGVCKVMHRLLRIVEAEAVFMGQKDFQQCMVVQQLLTMTGIATKLVIVPTLRETDGLAMSSRNMRLQPDERKTAAFIYQALLQMKQQLNTGDVVPVKTAAANFLTSKGFKVDYTELANAHSLELMHEWNGKDKIVALIAASLNDVRLIDNMIITS
ncbi:MAG: pantoate--beta-alanine ligase [Chitinophagaceae bacterium]|jgi:pantoate--beta-alanine ligase|nr:pantoate--beta-alanine ligase [Chitinophagaceae bacterium]